MHMHNILCTGAPVPGTRVYGSICTRVHHSSYWDGNLSRWRPKLWNPHISDMVRSFLCSRHPWWWCKHGKMRFGGCRITSRGYQNSISRRKLSNTFQHKPFSAVPAGAGRPPKNRGPTYMLMDGWMDFFELREDFGIWIFLCLLHQKWGCCHTKSTWFAAQGTQHEKWKWIFEWGVR